MRVTWVTWVTSAALGKLYLVVGILHFYITCSIQECPYVSVFAYYLFILGFPSCNYLTVAASLLQWWWWWCVWWQVTLKLVTMTSMRWQGSVQDPSTRRKTQRSVSTKVAVIVQCAFFSLWVPVLVYFSEIFSLFSFDFVFWEMFIIFIYIFTILFHLYSIISAEN